MNPNIFRKALCFIQPLTLLVVIGAYTPSFSQDSLIQLFNGKDLDGWHMDIPMLDTTPDAIKPFLVRDGKLVSLGESRGHLITDAS